MADNGHLLTGADHFHLLIDRQMRQRGLAGNISRMHLELVARADIAVLADALQKDATLQRVSRLRLKYRWPVAPKWMEVDDASPAVFTHDGISTESFRALMNSALAATSVPVRIDLCALDDGARHVIISMHHALFDHRGMMLFLRALAEVRQTGQFFILQEKRNNISDFADAVRGMFSAIGSGGWKLGTLAEKTTTVSEAPVFHEFQLTEEQTIGSDAAARAAGSRPGRSAFYLAVTLVALRELLDRRGHQAPYFWVPVPHDMRRRGGEGHLVGNDLSFLFFKLMREDLQSVELAVAAIQRQLTAQIRKGSLHHQAAVQRVLRFIPFWLMNAMVGLTTGGRISTLAFSDLGEERSPLGSFLGEEILHMSHIPPVPVPPGLSVVFLREKGKQRMVFGGFHQILSPAEMQFFQTRVLSLITAQT